MPFQHPTLATAMMSSCIIAAQMIMLPIALLVGYNDSYLARDRRTEVEIQSHDGRKVRISSQAFKQKELEELLRQCQLISNSKTEQNDIARE